jgi:hypothetical protein
VTACIRQLEAPWDPHPSLVELLTPSGDPAKGVPVRASVSEFGAQLLAKLLHLDDVQASVLSVVFRYADSGRLLLATSAGSRSAQPLHLRCMRAANRPQVQVQAVLDRLGLRNGHDHQDRDPREPRCTCSARKVVPRLGLGGCHGVGG